MHAFCKVAHIVLSSVLLIVVCLLTLTGCGSGTSGGNPALSSGIQGQATRGPLSTVDKPGQSNEAPLPGVIITILTPDGAEVARQTTDSQGNYKIGLSPGAYQVKGLPPNGSQGLPSPPAPQTVNVPTDQYVVVNISYDTGIR